jgi:Calcineurin-like phosphoesterase superfamily domain
MRILIVSDLHANLEALSVLPADYDQMWVLGDLVNYGPNPREAIAFVRENATLVVSGNHDYAIGFNTDPRCSTRYRAMAVETGRITQALISEEERGYLRTCRSAFGRRFKVIDSIFATPLRLIPCLRIVRPNRNDGEKRRARLCQAICLWGTLISSLNGKYTVERSSIREAWDNPKQAPLERHSPFGRTVSLPYNQRRTTLKGQRGRSAS